MAMEDPEEIDTSTETEYHCDIAGCDAHFPEEEQAHAHIVEDHPFLEHIHSLVEKNVVEPDSNGDSE